MLDSSNRCNGGVTKAGGELAENKVHFKLHSWKTIGLPLPNLVGNLVPFILLMVSRRRSKPQTATSASGSTERPPGSWACCHWARNNCSYDKVPTLRRNQGSVITCYCQQLEGKLVQRTFTAKQAVTLAPCLVAKRELLLPTQKQLTEVSTEGIQAPNLAKLPFLAVNLAWCWGQLVLPKDGKIWAGVLKILTSFDFICWGMYVQSQGRISW